MEREAPASANSDESATGAADSNSTRIKETNGIDQLYNLSRDKLRAFCKAVAPKARSPAEKSDTKQVEKKRREMNNLVKADSSETTGRGILQSGSGREAKDNRAPHTC